MRTIQISDVLKDKILVSRESARLLEEPLRAMMAKNKTQVDASGPLPVVMDFKGVEGIAPSFLDELVSVLESLLELQTTDGLVMTNIPTRLSSKFQAVARGHGLSIQSLPDGSWRLTSTRSACA
ncbi:MAG: STAS-like domain-containing protein [Phycisphaerales bacterium]